MLLSGSTVFRLKRSNMRSVEYMREHLEKLQSDMDIETTKYVEMMKKWHSGTASAMDRSDLESQKAKLDGLQQRIDACIEVMEAELGFPVGFFNSLEEHEHSEPTRLRRVEQAASAWWRKRLPIRIRESYISGMP